jgi:hypothetical protein
MTSGLLEATAENELVEGRERVLSPRTEQLCSFHFTTLNQAWQHLPAAIDPSAQLSRGGSPVPLVDAPSQSRHLQPPSAKVEGEVHDGRKSPFGFGGKHRAVTQRCFECGH